MPSNTSQNIDSNNENPRRGFTSRRSQRNQHPQQEYIHEIDEVNSVNNTSFGNRRNRQNQSQQHHNQQNQQAHFHQNGQNNQIDSHQGHGFEQGNKHSHQRNQHPNSSHGYQKTKISLDQRKKLESVQETELNTISCIICANSIDYCAIYENCTHGTNDLVCWKCSLSIRKMMNDKRCCICKVESDRVIFSHTIPKSSGFSAYNLKQLYKIPEWKCFVIKSNMIAHIRSYFDIYCVKCGDIFRNIEQLKRHVRDAHSLHYCDVCLRGRKVYLKDQKLYSYKELMKHIDYGEEDETIGRIDPHPECLFCKKRQYNDEELFFHMFHSHEKCHLCEAKGHKYEFFQNYSMLQIHFDQYHYRCHYPQCSHFVVFDNQLLLNHHILTTHGSELSRKEKERLKNITPGELQSTQLPDVNAENRLNQYQNIDATVIRFMMLNGENVYLGDYQRSTRYNIKSHQKEEVEKEQSKSNTIAYQPQRRSAGAFSQRRVDKEESLESEVNKEKREKMTELSKRIRLILGDNKYKTFQDITQQFQTEKMKASEFYHHFFELFGENEEDIFQSFISCIPSKDKQRADALIFARNTFHTKEYQHIRETKNNAPTNNSLSNDKDNEKDVSKKDSASRKQASGKKTMSTTIIESEEQWPLLSNSNLQRGPVPMWVGSHYGEDNSFKRSKKLKKQKDNQEEFPALIGNGSGESLVPAPGPTNQWANINARVTIGGRQRRRHK